MKNDTPFNLAYLDWCKKRGITKIEDTFDRALIAEFHRTEWKGKEVNGIELAIAMGRDI